MKCCYYKTSVWLFLKFVSKFTFISGRPNLCIVRNQPNRTFGNSLSESSAEVRPNRTRLIPNLYYLLMQKFVKKNFFLKIKIFLLKLLGNGRKFGSARVRPNFLLCRKLLCLLFVRKFGRTSAEPKVRSITIPGTKMRQETPGIWVPRVPVINHY